MKVKASEERFALLTTLIWVGGHGLGHGASDNLRQWRHQPQDAPLHQSGMFAM